MRLTRLLSSFALVIGFTIGMLAFVPDASGIKVPADFTFEQGKDSTGPVTFSHEKHKEKAEKCTVCHTKVFQMKRGKSGPLTMAAMQEGKFCGACHDGKQSFGVKDEANCNKCHAKK